MRVPRRSDTSATHRPARRARARGQAMTEYAIVAGLGLAVLFVPWLPSPAGGGARVSIFTALIQALDVYIHSFHAVITLPIP